MTVKIIHVAVGVVINEEGQILIAKRAHNQHQGGLWEFPGGKVEPDESVFDALVREFAEEVDLRILNAVPLQQIKHDYGDKHVFLDVWLSRQPSASSNSSCVAYEGQARGKENQKIAWVNIADLESYSFPEANKEIIGHIKKLDI
jgi:8-oxo-dGTP diphosphatase